MIAVNWGGEAFQRKENKLKNEEELGKHTRLGNPPPSGDSSTVINAVLA